MCVKNERDKNFILKEKGGREREGGAEGKEDKGRKELQTLRGDTPSDEKCGPFLGRC